MTLRDLTQQQWNAALQAARALCDGNPHNAADRMRYREARANLCAVLPQGSDASDIITRAVRWKALNDIAGAFAGMEVVGD